MAVARDAHRTQSARRKATRAAQQACEADDAAPPIDASVMARIRLGGVLDAMQRAGLTASRLVALADRLAAGYEVASDFTLLAALPVLDLLAANLTPAAFIISAASPLRAAVDALRRADDGLVDALIPPAVIAAGQRAAAALRDRLQVLPDSRTLALIGDALERGLVDDDALAVVRALPAAYLRGKASQRHWGVFAEYRAD